MPAYQKINESNLKEYLAKWQRRLGLSDWIITVSFKDVFDMQHIPAKALIHETIQCADIRLLKNQIAKKLIQKTKILN